MCMQMLVSRNRGAHLSQGSIQCAQDATLKEETLASFALDLPCLSSEASIKRSPTCPRRANRRSCCTLKHGCCCIC